MGVIAGQQTGYFIHISTASGQKGDSARLETEEMKPNRECNVQCLEFYYFHSGNESDELNIWIREFQDELDTDGTLRLMERIIGNFFLLELDCYGILKADTICGGC